MKIIEIAPSGMSVNNTVIDQSTSNSITIVNPDSCRETVEVSQPLVNVIEVATVGPAGSNGPAGAPGPSGSSQPFSNVSSNVWATTSSIQITGSFTVSGSSTFTNIGLAIFTGSAFVNGYPILTSNNTGSFLISSSFNTFTSSYYTVSESISYRLTTLEQFSSSLDATFATNTQLNSATASLSSSISNLNSSFQSFSSSFSTGSFYGTFYGTASWAQRSETASYFAETDPVFSSISASLATTGSNNFNGNQIITGSLIQGLAGNIATGEDSHAEGSITKAIGNYSHAEGDFTQAKGDYSHAEGQETIASGSYSHAEGYQTIALANHQHVQGQFNAVSSVPAAFIVGNGTDDGNRSNLIYAAGNEVQITGSLNVTTSITGSSFVGKLATTQIAVTTATASISTIISSSVKRGIFSATEQIEPYIPSDVFSGVSIEYNAQRIGSVRSGIILASWSGSDISFTDVSNADMGETYDLSFNFIKVGSDIILRANSLGSGSGDWTVQFLFKMFPNLL
jgi:hypothetical protein